MPWGWILSALLVPAGLLLLALALFHVRLRAAWGGAWESLDSENEGFFRVEYGFPGFMRTWDGSRKTEQEPTHPGGFSQGTGARTDGEPLRRESAASRRHDEKRDASDAAPDTRPETRSEASPAPSSSPLPPPPSPEPEDSVRSAARARRRRARRALFRLATDRQAWRLVFRHGVRTARAVLRLLQPRVAVAVGHPDPVMLARFAGYWHASAPLLSRSRATLELRFQDRRPTFAIRAEGGFSALGLLVFIAGNFAAFPWIGLARRAWHGWRRHELEGWRAWVYRKIQGVR